MDKFEHTTSADIVKDNLEALKALFPETFTEGKIDFEVLKQILGGLVEEKEEKYGLNWHGKRLARQIALTPSTGTLRPCKGEGVDEETTKNIFIEGDNLEVLKLLQKSYSGKVKMIYIDPPYNTGRDFVYPDNFKDGVKNYLALTRQIEGGVKITSNPESSGRFHTEWLNMMYPRLRLARNLLTPDGAIFISIDDGEQDNLKKLCNEIFGENNLISQLIWKSGRTAAAHFVNEHEYVLCYAKDRLAFPLFSCNEGDEIIDRATKRPSSKNPISEINFPAGMDFQSPDKKFPSQFGDAEPISVKRGQFEARNGKLASDVTLEAAWSMRDMIVSWLNGEEVYDQKGQRIKRFFFKENGVLQYEKERGVIHPKSIIDGITTKLGSKSLEELGLSSCFSFPKPTRLIQNFISLFIKNEDIVMDFFGGSGTSAHAVMAQNAIDNGNRRYILVQLPEPLDPDNADQKNAATFCDSLDKARTIAELTKERLRRAGKKIKEENPIFAKDVGFRVFKLDTSNIHTWEVDKSNLDRTLEDFMLHLKKDRSEEDILTELLLKLGLDLTVPIKSRRLADKKVYNVGLGALIVCLDTSIKSSEVESLALGIVEWHKEIASESESSLVFRDSAFENDIAKTNLTAILEQYGLTNIRSL